MGNILPKGNLTKVLVGTISLFFIFCEISFAQTAASAHLVPGIPRIINFSREVYNASGKNWSAGQMPDGRMAFGNSRGLLIYDGAKWDLKPSPNNNSIRSIAATADGKIYIGAYGEAGYWDYTRPTLPFYVSLDSLLLGSGHKKQEIWKIIPTQEFVLFQSFSDIFLLYSDRTVVKLVAPHPFIFIDEVNGKLLMPVPGDQMYEIRNRQLTPVPGSKVLAPFNVKAVLPFIGNDLLIATDKDGLWIFNSQTGLKPLQGAASNWLKNSVLNCAIRLQNGTYAFGTINNGIILCNEKGDILTHINKTTGLQINTVLNLMEDKDNNLWVMLDKGIDLIVLNSPFRFCFDSEDVLGSVLHAVVWQNKIWLATNRGLFFQPYQDWLNGSRHYERVKGLEQIVWNLSVWNNQLIIGYQSGTYTMQGNVLKQISNMPGGWATDRLVMDTNYLIQGNYTGIALYNKNTLGEWQFYKKTGSNYTLPFKELAQDSDGYIWLRHASQGIYRMKLKAAPEFSIEEMIMMDTVPGFPMQKKLFFLQRKGKVLLTSAAGMYSWNNTTRKIQEDTSLKKELGLYWKAPRIISNNQNNNLWAVMSDGRLGYIAYDEKGVKRSYSFSNKNFYLNSEYQKIVPFPQNDFLLCGEEGVAVFSFSIPYKEKYLSVKTGFTHLLIQRDNIWKEEYIHPSQQELSIPSDIDNFILRYATPIFDQSLRYRYKLEKEGERKEDWSDWRNEGEMEFQNIQSGAYTFSVETDVVDAPLILTIHILPPWYFSIWAKIAYTLLITGLIMWAFRWKSHKLQLTHLQEKRKMEEELKKQQEQMEREQEQFKQKQLEQNLLHKEKELADSAMLLVKKNETLQKIKNTLLKAKEEGMEASHFQLSRLLKLIDRNVKNEDGDWQLFESNFNQVHENFYKNVLARYPDLTAQDLKLAALLRMNLSSKEIAPILSITVKSVELKRYRLRKKLELSADDNLIEFLFHI